MSICTSIEYQDVLSDDVERRVFKFNTRPSPNVKNGIIYSLQRFTPNSLNGLYVENMSFFEKTYGSESGSTLKCNLRGHAEIKNEKLNRTLISKIKTGLKASTGKELFTDDCNLVLRFGGINTCSGTQDGLKVQSVHLKCSQAKKLFESLKSTEICTNTNVVPCLFKTFVHNYKDFNNIKFYSNDQSGTGEYTMFNEDSNGEKRFIINQYPKIHPDENIYLLHSNKLSGLVNINITGVYVKDDVNLSDTIKVWCRIESCHLLSNLSEISEFLKDDEDETDDVLSF